MDGRASANADAIVQGKVGREQFDGFLGYFFRGMSLLQDPLNFHVCDIWIHVEKSDSQPKEVKQKTVSKKENRCFSFKECLVILGFFSLADLLFFQSDDPWVF